MKKLYGAIRQEDIFIVILLAFVCLLSLSAYRSIGVGDSGEYVNAAYDLSHGHIPLASNDYANRIGTNAPFALAMKFLGWYGIQLTYVSGIIFLLMLVLVYCTVSKYNKTVALFSVSLLGLSNIMLTNSAAVMGDMTITLMANAPVLVYFWFIASGYRESKKAAKLFGLVSGILLVMAVLTKESVAFYLPLLFYLAYCDFKDKKQTFWICMFGISAAGGLLIGLWYTWMTGDFFYKIHEINAGCSQSDCNYSNAPISLILKRITFQPAQFLVEDYTFGLLSLLSLLNLVRKSPSKEVHFFKVYLIATLGLWWVGPQGLPWNPVALVHRLWMPLLVPMAINSAIILPDIITGKLTNNEKWKMSIAVFIFLAMAYFFLYQLAVAYNVVNEPQHFFSLGAYYTLIGLMIVVSFFVGDEFWPYYLPGIKRLLIIVILLSLVGFGNIVSAAYTSLRMFGIIEQAPANTASPEYYQEKQMILYVESLNPVCVLTDNNLSRKYHIYDNFVRNYPFKDWGAINADSLPDKTYLLVNKNRLAEARRNLPETLIYTHDSVVSNLNAIPDFVDKPAKYGFKIVNCSSTHEVWQKQ